MTYYPVHTEPDDGTLLVTAPDFPELVTFGDDEFEALRRAADALSEAIAARRDRGEDVPLPSRHAGAFYVGVAL